MAVTFHKMHGLGNDFILLDLREQDFQLEENIVTRLSDRRTGIGCDQVLVLKQPRDGAGITLFEVWNADGSRAEQCGNGVRCMALYLQMQSSAPLGRFSLSGPAGNVLVECLGDGMVQVDMGRPVFEPLKIPVFLEPSDGWYQLDTREGVHRLGAASMGNPHALMVVDDIGHTDVAGLGGAISTHPAFPNGCNAGFVQIKNRKNVHLRVFERGAAETMACGSGACAAVSILRKANLVDEKVNVTQSGGILIITWTGGEKPVIMKGPATHVFEGKLT